MGDIGRFISERCRQNSSCFLEFPRQKMDVSRRHLGGLSLADIAIDAGQLNCGAYVLLGGLEFAIKNCDTTSVYERTSEHPRVWMTFENRFRNVAVTHGFVKVTTLPFQDRNTDVEIS